MSKRHYFEPAVTIPEHWTADEALVIVSFLRCISESIWAAHGHQIAKRLHLSDERGHETSIPLPNVDLPELDDDMPF